MFIWDCNLKAKDFLYLDNTVACTEQKLPVKFEYCIMTLEPMQNKNNEKQSFIIFMKEIFYPTKPI